MVSKSQKGGAQQNVDNIDTAIFAVVQTRQHHPYPAWDIPTLRNTVDVELAQCDVNDVQSLRNLIENLELRIEMPMLRLRRQDDEKEDALNARLTDENIDVFRQMIELIRNRIRVLTAPVIEGNTPLTGAPAQIVAQMIDGGKKNKKTKKTKKTRKHRGIVQTGGNKGKLRKGYKYTGKKLKNGSAEIKKVKKNKK